MKTIIVSGVPSVKGLMGCLYHAYRHTLIFDCSIKLNNYCLVPDNVALGEPTKTIPYLLELATKP